MRHVLVVDDTLTLRELTASTLREAGYDVTTAEDGFKALEVAGSRQFAAVLTDYNMPGMHGVELTGKLRQLPDYRQVPILLVTTETDEEKKLAGKAAGANGWINKPFNPEKLVMVVNKLLGVA